MLLVALGTGCTAVPALVQCRKAEASLRDLESRASEMTADNGTPGHDAAAFVHDPSPAHGSARFDPIASYELTLARSYLDKAREEASEAHYGLSIQLAKSSQQASKRAGNALTAARTKPDAGTAGPRRRL